MNCYECKYKKDVPGNCHIACTFNFPANKIEIPKGNPHGIKNGWFIFPFLFDPTWMIDECKGFEKL